MESQGYRTEEERLHEQIGFRSFDSAYHQNNFKGKEKEKDDEKVFRAITTEVRTERSQPKANKSSATLIMKLALPQSTVICDPAGEPQGFVSQHYRLDKGKRRLSVRDRHKSYFSTGACMEPCKKKVRSFFQIFLCFCCSMI